MVLKGVAHRELDERQTEALREGRPFRLSGVLRAAWQRDDPRDDEEDGEQR